MRHDEIWGPGVAGNVQRKPEATRRPERHRIGIGRPDASNSLLPRYPVRQHSLPERYRAGPIAARSRSKAPNEHVGRRGPSVDCVVEPRGAIVTAQRDALRPTEVRQLALMDVDSGLALLLPRQPSILECSKFRRRNALGDRLQRPVGPGFRRISASLCRWTRSLRHRPIRRPCTPSPAPSAR